MKKLIGLFILLIVFLSAAQMNLNSNLVQPAKSIDGGSIFFTAGVYIIPSSLWGKGIMYYAGADSGDVWVRLVGNATTTWTKFQLGGGSEKRMLFDRIREVGTTANLDSLVIFTTTN